MSVKFQVGLDVITSYKRLAYTPWHAIAEFVDNSTQSYIDHRLELDDAYAADGEGLQVSVTYDRNQGDGFLRIADNAMGMSYEELERALHVALPPLNTTGRSKYGMGTKTAACWLGNVWSVRTKRLGETAEHTIVVDVARVAAGQADLPYNRAEGKPAPQHYTVIEIYKHNRKFHGRTMGKIRDFLRSMYREDFRNGILRLEWQGSPLGWDELDEKMLVAPDGSRYKKDFEFAVNGKRVTGWVGILRRGSRQDAGFSIIHCGRVVRGWPDSWRPTSLYGQMQGSNDLVNQRLVGEIHLDEFEVSHTKDDILWLGDEEDQVEGGLREHCGDYRDYAKEYRKYRDDQRGPTELETQAALDELRQELSSPEMVDQISITLVPPEQIVAHEVHRIVESVADTREETLRADVGDLAVKLYVNSDMSPNDPYVTSDATRPDEVLVVVNTAHPHWSQIRGSEGVANYFRHCIYDAIAEWQARSRVSRIDPWTIKLLKDRLLRVPFTVEGHDNGEEEQ